MVKVALPEARPEVDETVERVEATARVSMEGMAISAQD